jgi:uncharacterized protein DUF402
VSAPLVIERKRRLDGTFVEFECARLAVQPGRRAVLRYVIAEERELEGTSLLLPAGTVTIGHYWVDRPYNVYHWVDRGRTLAYYCSIAAETVIEQGRVEYLDLTVDVLIDPSGSALVLDEDELPADLDSSHRRTIARALDELTSHPKRLAAEIDRESARWLPTS